MLKDLVEEQKKEIERQNAVINDLLKLYNNAVEYDRQKTVFFSNMVHELKTPLSVILGAIQLIEQKKSLTSSETKDTNKHFHTIRLNCYRLLRLINNILEITKIDSGYLKINPINYNIVSLIEAITQSVLPYAEQKGISLEFYTQVEEIITAVDIEKMERIILNLLSNAIKFTGSGGKVSVSIKRNKKKVQISVKDNGPGIPTSKQKEIFERFRQVGSSLTRESEGSGIGLSLVKSFVELHEGDIRVLSEEGKGSEFIVEIPERQCEAYEKAAPISKDKTDRIVEAINIEFSDIYATGALR